MKKIKKEITVISLFDGISCAQVALTLLGYKIFYFASEIDKYAMQITQKNFPNTKQLGSVTDLDKKDHLYYGYKGCDLLIGGSPCQDLSIAKKNRQGLGGGRSGLFWEYVRILKEVKPKYFVLENVNSMPKEAKQTITKALGVEPIMINAALVSAQSRKRLFWTNIPNVVLPEDRNIFLKDIIQKGVKTEKLYVLDKKGNEKLKSNTLRTSGRGSGFGDKHNWDTIRIAQLGKGGQGDRVYSIDGKSVNLSANGGGRGAKTVLYLIDDTIRKLTAVECERLQSLPDNYTEGVSNSQRYKCLGNAFNVEVVKHILSFIK